jgi:hypothetical protein
MLFHVNERFTGSLRGNENQACGNSTGLRRGRPSCPEPCQCPAGGARQAPAPRERGLLVALLLRQQHCPAPRTHACVRPLTRTDTILSSTHGLGRPGNVCRLPHTILDHQTLSGRLPCHTAIVDSGALSFHRHRCAMLHCQSDHPCPCSWMPVCWACVCVETHQPTGRRHSSALVAARLLPLLTKCGCRLFWISTLLFHLIWDSLCQLYREALCRAQLAPLSRGPCFALATSPVRRSAASPLLGVAPARRLHRPLCVAARANITAAVHG